MWVEEVIVVAATKGERAYPSIHTAIGTRVQGWDCIAVGFGDRVVLFFIVAWSQLCSVSELMERLNFDDAGVELPSLVIREAQAAAVVVVGTLMHNSLDDQRKEISTGRVTTITLAEIVR